MRNRYFPTMLVLAALFAVVAAPAVAAEAPIQPNKPDSTELVNKMNVPGDITKGLFWNAKTVTFHGEAIGEVMVRDSYAWIHLNDDAYMEQNVEEGAKLGGYNSGMAVWVPADLANQIDTYGDYKHEGTIVEVTGVFNAACKEHGGDLDIHATSLRILRPRGRRSGTPLEGLAGAGPDRRGVRAVASRPGHPQQDRAESRRLVPRRRRVFARRGRSRVQSLSPPGPPGVDAGVAQW
jgi:hypothetical protein